MLILFIHFFIRGYTMGIALVMLLAGPAYAAFGPQWVSGRDLRVTQQIGQCSSNGVNRVGTYNVHNFKYQDAIQLARDSDKGREHGSRTCENGRSYSSGTAEGVRTFLDYVQLKGVDIALDYQQLTQECFEDTFTGDELARAIKLISDPENKAVVASQFKFDAQYNEHGESCGYFDWYIYRKDGTLLKWTIDESL